MDYERKMICRTERLIKKQKRGRQRNLVLLRNHLLYSDKFTKNYAGMQVRRTDIKNSS
jgi:hypothetical protein